jgi:hypothetical protein
MQPENPVGTDRLQKHYNDTNESALRLHSKPETPVNSLPRLLKSQAGLACEFTWRQSPS